MTMTAIFFVVIIDVSGEDWFADAIREKKKKELEDKDDDERNHICA